MISKKDPEPAAPLTKSLLGYYAGFMSRFLALAIDTILIAISFISLTWFVSVTATILQLRTFLGFSINSIPGSGSFIDKLFGPASAGILTVLYIISYHIFFWVLAGQTPGKAFMGLRVVTVEGRKISPARALLRIIGYAFSAIPLYLGFLWVLWDDRRQGWHDKLAGTCVIYTWEARPDERFLVEEINNMGKAHSRLRGLLPRHPKHPPEDQQSA
jgi:uncharacterized RDD family membrane protein YckC